MGVVYRARQHGLDRLVALKMLRGGSHADAETLARFRIEVRAVARLRHHNVVQVFDVGESQGLPYVSLELLEGGSLEAKNAGTPQPERAAATLLATLARAIASAHAAGIVHRDLKPANVLFTPRRRPQDHRLRPGQAARRGRRADPIRAGDGLAQLHGSRAGPRRCRAGRLRRRHLLARRHPLRDDHGPSPVQGGLAARDPPPGRPRRAGPPVEAPPRPVARPRNDLPEVPGQGTRAALRDGRRPGRRPRPVPRRGTDRAPGGSTAPSAGGSGPSGTAPRAGPRARR